MSETRLDRSLDAALREMVAEEGSPDLRRRVLARLAEPPPRRAMRWPALAAAAGIAVAVASVALLRTAPGREGVAPSVRAPAPPLPVSPPAAAAVAALPLMPTTPAPPYARPPRGPRPQGEGRALEAEVWMDLEPIELAPLAVAPIRGERIAVAELSLDHMSIEPLADPPPLTEKGRP
jgi:hypothetical protein